MQEEEEEARKKRYSIEGPFAETTITLPISVKNQQNEAHAL